jgi:phospholipid transport system substrate-binding protein
MTLISRLATLSAALLLAGTPAAFAQSQAPEDLIKNTFEEAKATVQQTQDARKLRAIADQKLRLFFDFERMTRLAVGPGWRGATPAQRVALTDAFRELLGNTYNSALAQASSLLEKTLEIRQVQRTDEKDVLVRSLVRSPNKAPMAVDYRLFSDGTAWKVYDVVVEGVSLVTTYRTEFGEEVRRAGVPGLIKSLEDKNRTLAAR